MADVFDPYYQWLGIRDPRCPPDHYRLLGVAPFEDDPEVLQNAADRQMAHVRTFQTGRHSAESQQLLNELAGAKLCLLDPEKKASYDGLLRAEAAGDERGATGRTASKSRELTAPGEPPTSAASSHTFPGPVRDSRELTAPGEPPTSAASSHTRAVRPWLLTSTSSSVALVTTLLSGLALLITGLAFAWAHGWSKPESQRPAVTEPRLVAGPNVNASSLPRTVPPSKPTAEIAVKPQAGAQPKLPPQVVPSRPFGNKQKCRRMSCAKPSANVAVKSRAEVGAKPRRDVGTKPGPEVAAMRPADVGSAPKAAGARPKLAEPPKQPPSAPPIAERPAAPPAEELQTTARREIANDFLADYAAALDRDHQRALAAKLYQQATQTQDDPTVRYVAYSEARDIAVAAGDVELLQKVVRDLGEAYRLDPESLIVAVLANAAKHPVDLSVSRDPAQVKILAKAAKQPRGAAGGHMLPPAVALDRLVKVAKQVWDPAASRDLGRLACKRATDSLRRGEFDFAESLAASARELAVRAERRWHARESRQIGESHPRAPPDSALGVYRRQRRSLSEESDRPARRYSANGGGCRAPKSGQVLYLHNVGDG